MEAVATQKFLRMSPRKLRVVANMVKKMPPAQAVEYLPYIGKRAALPIQKVIKTAIANAQVKGMTIENLAISEIQIGEGPRLKRFRAGSRGRAKPYTRDMSHIRVVLKDIQKGTVKKDTKPAAVEAEIVQMPEEEKQKTKKTMRKGAQK